MFNSSPDRPPIRSRLLIGFLCSTGIGLLAYRRHSLSRNGIAGAVVTGTSTFGLGGPAWGLSLIFFFISSSLLSHFRASAKSQTAADKFSKGSQRDIAQVAANGGVATALALGYGLAQSPSLRATCEAGFVGALATANADTWATEIGVLSHQAPRLITTGKATTPGTSGGVTLLGSGAAASGALAEGIVFNLLLRRRSVLLPINALLSGFGGSLIDSLLGATVQAMYYCPNCQQETEKHVHSCGTSTTYLRGVRWMDNDVVNFLATLSGSIIAIGIQLPFNHKKLRP